MVSTLLHSRRHTGISIILLLGLFESKNTRPAMQASGRHCLERLYPESDDTPARNSWLWILSLSLGGWCKMRSSILQARAEHPTDTAPIGSNATLGISTIPGTCYWEPYRSSFLNWLNGINNRGNNVSGPDTPEVLRKGTVRQKPL
ncbi:hypothetical protein HOY80DRAFT_947196 [Tuber brumale]|nr:hypothetical protein HOY80DRAFT_947196 [Tuber brumale]